MKDGKDGSPEKPFYQNILDERARKRAKSMAKSEAKLESRARADASGKPRSGVAGKPAAGKPLGPGAAGKARPAGAGRAPGASTASAGATSRGPSPRGPLKPFTPPPTGTPVFGGLSAETRSLLEDFPSLVQSVLPLDSKKLQQLPQEIRELSHELTDERSERRVGYMNEPPVLSAYIRYFMWWNLVRLTRLLASMPLSLAEGDAAVDLGSGPLTLPIALWMARPELRSLDLTWYCVDLSQGALSAGEELFLALAAKTGNAPWKIVRVKGELGVTLRRRVALVASANMFNELFWDNPDPIEAQAKRHAQGLASYADESSSVLLIEPGVPRAGRFVSLMRDSLMRLGFVPESPCPHAGMCPFPGLRNGKWCHFVFDTADAPKSLHKLSDDSGLSKDRAALSFVYARRSVPAAPAAETPEAGSLPESDAAFAAGPAIAASGPAAASPLETLSRLTERFASFPVRVTSDPIRLPGYRTGRYGCSEEGMVLVVGSGNAGEWLDTGDSGARLELTRPQGKNPPRDEKTGALLIELGGRDRPPHGGNGARSDRPGREPGPRGDRRDSRDADRGGYAGRRPLRDSDNRSRGSGGGRGPKGPRPQGSPRTRKES